MFRLIGNIVLLVVAYAIATVLLPLGFAYTIIGILFFQNKKLKRLENYLFQIAVTIDQMGNVVCAYLFNDVLIRQKNYKFGNPDETISSVLGKNKNNLRLTGKMLRWFLDKVEKNHIEKSVEEVKKIKKDF
jgi:hypothetical protein